MSGNNQADKHQESAGTTGKGQLFHFGPYELDPSSGRIFKHHLRIKLSGQPVEVLALLLEHAGEVVTREELRQRLWPTDVYVDFERSLNSAVKKLRRALNDDPQEPLYIETLPKKGYRFIGTLEPAGELPFVNQPETTETAAELFPGSDLVGSPGDADGASSQKRVPRQWIWMSALSLAVVIVASTLVYRTHPNAQAVPQAAPAKNVKVRSSIAVLGFKNLSSGRDADWLSTAITQMLTTELASGEKVRIIPEETVARAKVDLRLKEKDGYPQETLRALRTDLGSDYIVAGSYVAMGDKQSGQVRLDLRLQETISGETLASIAVSGKQAEIFDLVVRAGREMRAKLGATVPPEGDVDWRTVLPSNPEAARLYSEGLAHLRIFENLTASEKLARSVTIEPNFALGHAALAEAWAALGYGARAVSSAQKAQALSNSLPEDERLEIEGRYYELSHDWTGAIGAYRHLWQDFPDDVESGLKLAAAQTSAGNLNDALATLSSLRSTQGAQRDDARIDLAEAEVAARNADYRRQQNLAEAAAKKAQSSGARLLLARAQLVRGWALDDQSQLKEAKEAYSLARQIFEEAGDRDGTATALNDLGIVLQKQGDLAGAKAKLEQARALFREVGDNNGHASVLTNLGEVYRAQGEFTQAEDLYHEALRNFRASGRKDSEYATMNNLGAVLYQKGDFQGAKKLFEELLEVRKAAGDKNGAAFAMTNLADALSVQGELGRAVPLYRQGLTTFREIGDRASAAAVQVPLARALIAMQDFAGARRTLQEALNTNQEIGAKGDAALDRILLAELALEEGRTAEVEPLVRENLPEFHQEGRADDEIEAHVLLARAFLAQGKPAAAAEALRPALELAGKGSERLGRFHLILVAARARSARGDVALARHDLASALTEAREMGCMSCQLEARLALSETQIKDGEGEKGRAQLQAVAKEARDRGFTLIASRAAAAGK
jgi:DNA-binding winged helix-turn-helix (wHTH) protein/tetratricopeptide (TPR) repeat protein/TolB-like protein